jgi:5-methylcytosine-specific restriction protein A
MSPPRLIAIKTSQLNTLSMEKNLIMVKDVDKSVLDDGFTIPSAIHDMFYEITGETMFHGDRKKIHVFVDGKEFDVELKNQDFNQEKFDGHKDVLQIRYSHNSDFSQLMRTIFSTSYNYITEQRKIVLPRHQVKIPNEIKEQLMLYKSAKDDTYYIECLTASDHIHDIQDVVTEETFEASSEKWIDPKASIETVSKLVKIRRIDQSISNNLKQLYKYCDQITGEKIGDKYGEPIVEAHHIDFFVNSQNNDASNIIILSPNFHRIVHHNKPIFDRTKKAFIFPNGVIEPIRLNKHL